MKVSATLYNPALVSACLFCPFAATFKTFGQDSDKITIERPRYVRVGFKTAPANWGKVSAEASDCPPPLSA